MTSKAFSKSIFIRALIMFATLFLASYVLVKEWYAAEIILVPLIVYQFFEYYQFHKKAQVEIEQFVESVHYRDFSRHFDVKQAPSELQPFRSGFNQINSTFKVISKEKETQYLHLKTILEIVDTGILSYETEGGEILWMNESFKKLLQIPYLKTIHSLAKRNEALYKEVIELMPGNNIVISIPTGKETIKIQLSATAFQNENKKFKLIAFQNINEALDENETNAWQKLLRVMTHELMNSVAPISSLADTLKNRVAEASQKKDFNEDSYQDIETGISTIKKRTEGLLKFTETYRSLSKITFADINEVLIIELFEHVSQLLQPTIENNKIELEIILKEPLLSFKADANLIEQVLINLMLNAIDAVKEKEKAKITLSAYRNNMDKVFINVVDNGVGIPADVADKIFIPFFSTKKTGSGIGLSLSKQIMLLHKGSIQVQSNTTEGTAIGLIF
ncbi:MAG TPA: HAMP domain-containing sensor histidine kinase [Bacteroidia bacterium]|nr:HAMP domain-containing sensor histidine kinase [Bacteroidia bacterium]